jgi:hypothetical protein
VDAEEGREVLEVAWSDMVNLLERAAILLAARAAPRQGLCETFGATADGPDSTPTLRLGYHAPHDHAR